jgi:hypothetical protein
MPPEAQTLDANSYMAGLALKQQMEDAGLHTEQDLARFPLIRLADLEAYDPHPEQNHLAGRGWLRRRAMTLFTGGTGLGKSVAVEQISVQVACGMPLFGRISVPHPYRVLVLQAENDMETLKRDITAIIKGTGAERDLVAENLHLSWVHSLSGQRFSDFATAVVNDLRPDLLVIDNYQSFSGDDINSTEAWNKWFAPLNALAFERELALLLVDHTGKPVDRKDWSFRQSVYMAAGSSRKSNAARCSAELTEVKNDPKRFRLRFGKNHDRAGLEDEDGRPVHDLYLEHSASPARPYWILSRDQTDPGNGKYDARIDEIRRQNPTMTQMEMARKLGISESTVSRSLARRKG